MGSTPQRDSIAVGRTQTEARSAWAKTTCRYAEQLGHADFQVVMVAVSESPPLVSSFQLAESKSTFNGNAYTVCCNGGKTNTAQQWLLDELAVYRKKLKVLMPKPLLK